MLKKVPFFLLLIAAFFCLHGSVENYGYLDAMEVMWVGLTISGCIIALFLGTFLFTRKMVFAALITFFIALWYLFFGAIHDWIKNIAWLQFLHSYSVILPLLLIVNIAYIILLKRYVSFQPKLFFYLNILLLVYCLIDVGLLLNKRFNNKNTAATTSTVVFETSKVTIKPNVYFIVLDGYAGYKTLQDSFGFKNDIFYTFLKQKSFNILPITSNYDFTFYSMASTLNMEYILGDFENKIAYQNDIQQRFNEVRKASVFAAFTAMNYDIENYSFFDVNVKQGIYNHSNSFFPIHSFLLLNKIFHKRLLSDLGWMLHAGEFKIEWLTKKHIYKNDTYNNKALQMLQKSITSDSVRPKLCYTHLLLPHEPYYKDSLGKYIAITKDAMYNKALYVSYVKYTNAVMQSIVSDIINKDSAAITVIMSDHGFNVQRVRTYSPSTFDNIFAVRFPDQKSDTSINHLTNVNAFRYIFNSQFNQKLPYLKDSIIWVKEFY